MWGAVLRGGGERLQGQGRFVFWVCTDARVCREGYSPVLIASVGGHISCVEALIRAKADVLQFDK